MNSSPTEGEQPLHLHISVTYVREEQDFFEWDIIFGKEVSILMVPIAQA